MKITFPHMGNIYIFMKVLFDELGVDYVIPPRCSKKTLELGARYAPEMACVPLKVNLGNFLESIELGADTILITGGFGPCRAGYYAEMHRQMLQDMGLKMDVITVEAAQNGVGEAMKNVRRLFPKSSALAALVAFFKSYKVIAAVDKLSALSYYVRPREKQKGATDRIMKGFADNVQKFYAKKQIMRYINRVKDELKNVPLCDKPIMKVGIVGEIFTLIEPFTSMYIDTLLGNMGVEIDYSLTLSKWIRAHIVLGGIRIRKTFEKAAYPYVKTMKHFYGHFFVI